MFFQGDYEFCFNNYNSKFLEKKVEVFIGIIHPFTPNEVELEEGESKNATIEVYQNMTVS